MSFLPLYLNFHLDSLHSHHDSSHTLHFYPDFPHSHANSPHPHSHPIPRISTLILRISLILSRNSPFWLLQIACSVCNLQEFILENSSFSSKANIPLCFYCINFQHQIIFTSYMTSSVLSPNII